MGCTRSHGLQGRSHCMAVIVVQSGSIGNVKNGWHMSIGESHAHHWGLYKISKILEKCAIDSFLQSKSDSSFRFAKN